MYFAFGFTTFAENLPTRRHLGALCPLAPLVAATASILSLLLNFLFHREILQGMKFVICKHWCFGIKINIFGTIFKVGNLQQIIMP